LRDAWSRIEVWSNGATLEWRLTHPSSRCTRGDATRGPWSNASTWEWRVTHAPSAFGFRRTRPSHVPSRYAHALRTDALHPLHTNDGNSTWGYKPGHPLHGFDVRGKGSAWNMNPRRGWRICSRRCSSAELAVGGGGSCSCLCSPPPLLCIAHARSGWRGGRGVRSPSPLMQHAFVHHSRAWRRVRVALPPCSPSPIWRGGRG
jgi:hypothetical protein